MEPCSLALGARRSTWKQCIRNQSTWRPLSLQRTRLYWGLLLLTALYACPSPHPWFDIYLFMFIHPCYRSSRISKVSLIIVPSQPKFTAILSLQHSNCSRPRPRYMGCTRNFTGWYSFFLLLWLIGLDYILHHKLSVSSPSSMEWHLRLGYTWWMSVLASVSINPLNRWAISGAQRLQNRHTPLRRYLWYVWICWPDQWRLIFQTGWVVLSGKTHIKDPLANFRNVFSGSSHSSNDVRLNSSFDKISSCNTYNASQLVRNSHFQSPRRIRWVGRYQLRHE